MSNKWILIAIASALIATGVGCGATAPAEEKIPAKVPAPIRPLPPAKPKQLAKPVPAETTPLSPPATTQLTSPMPAPAIDRALAKRVDLELTAAPLSDFVTAIKGQTGLEIHIAPGALATSDDAKAGPKTLDAAPVERLFEKPTEKPVDKIPEEKRTRPAEKAPEVTPEKPADKAPDGKKTETAPATPSERAADKTPEKPVEKSNAKASPKPAEKPAEKRTVKPAEKPADKASDKPADQPTDKAQIPADKDVKSPAKNAENNNSEKSTEKNAPPDRDSDADEAAAEPIVSVHLKGVSAASALNLVLRDVGLSWSIDHGGILIAKPDQLPATTAVYDIRQLVVAHPGFDSHDDAVELDYDPLVNLITGVIQCPAWSGEVDKIQDCNPFHGTLTVRQDQPVQQKVAGLLAALRKARDLPASKYNPSTNLGMSIVGADDSAVEAALDTNVIVAFNGEKLDPLADWIREHSGIPVHIDSAVPQSVENKQTFTLCAGGISLRTMLKSLLPQGKLTFTVSDETLVITSQDAVADLQTIRVYPVGDLIGGDIDRNGIDDDYAQLLDAITHNVQPETWAPLDRQKASGASGNAYAAYLPAARAVVVDQTSSAHEEIAATLAKLREAVALQPARKAIPSGAKPEADKQAKPYLSMRIYKLNPDLPAEDFVAVVHDLIEPKSWTGEAYLHGVPGAIVVKQTPAVHKRVERLLIELGAIPDPKKNGTSGTPILIGRQKRA